MSKAIELKSAVVAEIAEKFEKAASVIVVDYKGLTVEQVTDQRSQMRKAGVDMEKKESIEKALDVFKELVEELEREC